MTASGPSGNLIVGHFVFICISNSQLNEASRNPSADIDWNKFLADTTSFLTNSLGLLENLGPLLNMVDSGTGTEQLFQSFAGLLGGVGDVNSLDDFIQYVS